MTNKETNSIDANKIIDVKALIMAGLMFVIAWLWNVNQESRKRFEEQIISNDKRLNDRAMWMRVTDIRLSIIEKQLGIDPLDTNAMKKNLD